MSTVAREARASGLTAEEAAARLFEHGPNELPPPDRESWLRRWWRHLREPMSVLLTVAAIVSGVWLGETLEATAIMVIVVLNAVIAVVQEGRAQRALDALRQLETPTARVRRDGTVREIPTREIVRDDVVLIEAGDRVPADLELLDSSNLQIDESTLTGESLPVHRSAQGGGEEGRTLSGTLVTRGTATGRVTATGPDSALGRIATGLGGTQPPTPLQRELGVLSRRLGVMAIVLSLGVFGLVLLRTGADADGLRDAALTAIALAVAAVPEGLMAVTTIALALGVHRMAQHGAIVRRLPAVEALGATDVIAIDKTGTLTRNRMELTAVSLAGEHPVQLDELPDDLAWRIVASAVLASTATLDPPTGDPLEIALLEAAGRDLLNQVEDRFEVRQLTPFDAERRRSSAIAVSPAGLSAHLKGAPETVLELCNTVLTADGVTRDLDGPLRGRIRALTDRLAATGVRTLAIAGADLSDIPDDPDDAEHDLTLLAVIGLRDAVRDSARTTVAAVQQAGVQLLMVTGDHAGTAGWVAREVGLADADDRIVTGPELRRDGVPHDPTAVLVYARVEPDQKLTLVDALRDDGHTVAMTGDGVNDAPALQHADIGVALGMTGSDVAREAADLVITDDDLATIHVAVREGRAIYDNIRKVVDYLVAGNLSEIAVVIATLLLFPDLGIPLLPLQLLWINLLTDGLPALALGIDPAEPSLMRRPPRPRHQQLLTARRIGVLGGRGTVIALVTVTTLWISVGPWGASWEVGRTVLFTALVLAHLVYVLVARQPDVVTGAPTSSLGLTANRWLLTSIGAGAALQAGVVLWRPARTVFDTTALDARSWVLVVAAAFVPTALMLVTRRLRSRSSARPAGPPQAAPATEGR